MTVRQRSYLNYYPRVLLTLAGGLLLTALAAWQQQQHNRRQAEQLFSALAERSADQLVERMRIYAYGLRGARGVVTSAGEDGISRALFHRYSESHDIDREFPGARGFGFIRRVPRSEEASFLATARADGWGEFQLRQLAGNGGERFVIQYIEPVQRNAAAVGLDIASEARRRDAAMQAMRSGEATATAPITLVQASGERQQSVLLLLPIYRSIATPTTAAEREADTYGWSYAPLLLKEVLADLDLHGGAVALVLRDLASGNEQAPLYRSAMSDNSAVPVMFRRVLRTVYGRPWQLEVQAMPHFLQRLPQLSPNNVALAGSLASLLLAALVATQSVSRQRKRQIAAERAQLATIIENSADAIVGESLDGKAILWNPAAERLFGRAANEVLGQPLDALLLPPDACAEEAALRARIVAGESLPSFDGQRLHRDGHALDVSITSSAILGPRGDVVGVAKLIRDIGARKHSERRLVEFNAQLEDMVAQRTAELEMARRDLQTVLDSVPSMIGYWDRNLVCRVANRAYSLWFGVDASRVPGMRMRELLGDELFERNRPHVEAALRGEVQKFERAIPRPDGSGTRHSLAHYLPDITDGEVHGFYVIVHDISELTESRLALAQERERLGNLAQLLGDVLRAASEISIIATAVDGTIRIFNRGAELMLGYRAEELVGKSTPAPLHLLEEVVSRGRQLSEEFATPIEGFRVFVHRAERDGAETLEWTYVRKDGSQLPVSLTITTMRNEQGVIVGYLGIAQDISERRRVERMKSEFVATVSHELRTPLTAIVGALRLIASGTLGELPAAAAPLLEAAQRNSTRLGALIDDLLDLEKLAAGKMQFELRRQAVMPLVEQALDSIRHYGSDRGIHLQLLSRVDHAEVRVEAQRLQQVLGNLLSNAIKYSPDGGIVEVAVSMHDGQLRIAVSDHGPGIPEQFHRRLFERFAQADASDTRQKGGTGLGLAISRELIEGMHGHIGFSTEVGHGSCFFVELPLVLAST